MGESRVQLGGGGSGHLCILNLIRLLKKNAKMMCCLLKEKEGPHLLKLLSLTHFRDEPFHIYEFPRWLQFCLLTDKPFSNPTISFYVL